MGEKYDFEKNPVYYVCPLCGSHLDGSPWHFGECKCPKGHYRWCGRGSYASEAYITLPGQPEEYYYFDDMFDDSDKFEARIEELRKNDNG